MRLAVNLSRASEISSNARSNIVLSGMNTNTVAKVTEFERIAEVNVTILKGKQALHYTPKEPGLVM